MLDKLFPKEGQDTPDLRFAGFTDAWEQRKLGELMMIIGGNAWKSEDYSDTGNYLVVTIANVNGRYFIDDSFGNRIDVDNPGVYLLRKNDILISLTGNVGRVSKMTEIPAVLNQRVAKVVVDRANIDNEFIYQILSSFRFENAMIKAGQGAAQSNISNSNVKEYSAFMPNSRSEQAEIGAVFKHLDNLITLHQRKLDKLQNVKKSLLEKMFV
jgi:type I restriction enzyme S subunit